MTDWSQFSRTPPPASGVDWSQFSREPPQATNRRGNRSAATSEQAYERRQEEERRRQEIAAQAEAERARIAEEQIPDRPLNALARGVSKMGQTAVLTGGLARDAFVEAQNNPEGPMAAGVLLRRVLGGAPPKETAGLVAADEFARTMQDQTDQTFPKPAAQRKLERELGQAKGFVDTFGTMLKPSNLAGTAQIALESLASSLPITRALGVIGGAGAASGAEALDVGRTFDQQFDAFAKTPAFTALREVVGDDGVAKARDALKAQTIQQTLAGAMAGGALTAGATAKMGLNPIESAVAAGRKLTNTATKGVRELVGETIEGGGTQVAINAATGRPITEGVPESAAMEGAAGFVSGIALDAPAIPGRISDASRNIRETIRQANSAADISSPMAAAFTRAAQEKTTRILGPTASPDAAAGAQIADDAFRAAGVGTVAAADMAEQDALARDLDAAQRDQLGSEAEIDRLLAGTIGAGDGSLQNGPAVSIGNDPQRVDSREARNVDAAPRPATGVLDGAAETGLGGTSGVIPAIRPNGSSDGRIPGGDLQFTTLPDGSVFLPGNPAEIRQRLADAGSQWQGMAQERDGIVGVRFSPTSWADVQGVVGGSVDSSGGLRPTAGHAEQVGLTPVTDTNPVPNYAASPESRLAPADVATTQAEAAVDGQQGTLSATSGRGGGVDDLQRIGLPASVRGDGLAESEGARRADDLGGLAGTDQAGGVEGRVVQNIEPASQPAPPALRDLTDDERKDTNPAGRALRKRWKADFSGALSEYSSLSGEFNSDGGRILNTDIARELSPEYRADRTRSADVHEASSDFIKAAYAAKLAQPTPAGMDPVVLFTAGGTGAGKTTGQQAQADALGSPEIIYDTNMNGAASSVKKIEQALAAGRQVDILYTYRDPVEALTGGALPRAARMEREQGTGRTVPIEEHAKTHVGAYNTIKSLREKYASDDRVQFVFVDNSRGRGNAVKADFDELPPLEDNEGYGQATQEDRRGRLREGAQRGSNALVARLREALDAEYAAGRISESVYRGFGGTAQDRAGPATEGVGDEAPAGQTGASNQADAGTTDSTAVSGADIRGRPQDKREASRSSAGTVSAARTAIARALGDKFLRRLESQPWFHLVESLDQLPPDVRKSITGDGIAGFVLGNDVYIIADQASDPVGVTLHEVGVHFGMPGILGADFPAVLRNFKRQRAKDDAVGRAYERATEAAERGEDGELTADALATLDEEALAYYVEANWGAKDSRGIVAKVIDAIKSLLNRLGVPLSTINASPELLRNVAIGAARKAADGRVSVGKDGVLRYHKAWHGSPHDFDKFRLDDSTIGTGEGAQAFGFGLYYTDRKELAEHYRDTLSRTTEDFTAERERKLRDAAGALTDEADRADLQDAIDRLARGAQEYNVAADIRKYSSDDVNKAFFAVMGKGGKLYEVELAPQESDYLDWDAPLRVQNDRLREFVNDMAVERHKKETEEYVAYLRKSPKYNDKDVERAQIARAKIDPVDDFYDYLEKGDTYLALNDKGSKTDRNGELLYRLVSKRLGGDRAASAALRAAGIPGIRYLDGSSRSAGDGSRNYVIFDDSSVEVKAKYSRRADGGPVTESDKLVALHNVSPEGLLFADKIGGLAVPSIGITKAATPFTGFGSVTLIGSRDLATPSGDNPVFSADAFTQRFPDVEWPAVPQKKASDLLASLDADYRRRDTGEVFDALVNKPDRDEAIRLAEKSARFMRAWLEQNGESAPDVMEVKKPREGWMGMGVWLDAVDAMRARGVDVRNIRPEDAEWAELSKVAVRAVKEYAQELSDGDAPTAAYLAKTYAIPDGVLPYAKADRAISFALGRNDAPEVDRYGTRKAMEDKIGERKPQFSAWVASKIAPLFGEPSIRIGRKKVPMTLENVVEAMTTGSVAGKEKTLTFGTGKAKAMNAKQYRTLEEIQADRAKIVAPEVEKDAVAHTDKLLDEYRAEALLSFGETNWQGRIDTWAGLDAATKALADAAKKAATPANVRAALVRNGFRMPSPDAVRLGVESLIALRETVTDYFEAKPQRAVKLSEFAGAVVKSSEADQVRPVLEKHGVEVREYSGEDAERRVAIDEFTKELESKRGKIRFSRRAPTITIDGTDRPTTDSTGKAIHPTEEGLRNFWSWFAGSRATDGGGRPLALFHGTDKDVDAFDKAAAGSSTGALSAKQGFWFVDRADVASSYAEYAAQDAPTRRKMEQLEAAEKRAQHTGNWDEYDRLVDESEALEKEIGDQPMRGQNVIPAYVAIKNPAEFDADGETFVTVSDKLNAAIIRARRNGNDGMIVRNVDDDPRRADRIGDHYLVFAPEQVKSSTGNTGAFSPTDKRIAYSRKTAEPEGLPPPVAIESHLSNMLKLRAFFDSAVDVMARQPGLKPLADAVRSYFDNVRRRQGLVNEVLRAPVKAASKADLDAFERYQYALQNNLRADVAEELAGMTDKGRALVTAWEKVAKLTNDENQNVGVQVFDPKIGGWRKIGTARNFFPRVLKPKFQEAMRQPHKYPAEWNQLVRILLDAGRIESAEDAQEFLNTAFSNESAFEYFAGIEKARMEPLPRDLYDYSMDAAIGYKDAWADRLSQIDAFGQKIGQGDQAADKFDEVLLTVTDDNTRNYVTRVRERITNTNSKSPFYKFMANMNTLVTGLMLGNPATAALNIIGGLSNNAMIFPLGPNLRAFKELRHLGAGIRDAVAKGVLIDDYMGVSADAAAQGVSERLSNLTQGLLNWGGYNGTEYINRVHSMLVGKHFLSDSLAAINKNPRSRKSLLATAFMQRNGFDVDVLAAESMKPADERPETNKFLRFASNLTQGSYKIDQTPIFVDEPIGKFLFKYQKFGTQINRVFYQQMLRPFVQSVFKGGEPVTIKNPDGTEAQERVRNFVPLIRFIVGAIPGGMLVQFVREALFGYGEDGPDEDEIRRKLADGETAAAAGMLAERAFIAITALGAGGFLGNYMQTAKDFQERQRYKNPMDPPGLAPVKSFVNFVMKLNDQGKITMDDVEQEIQNNVSLYRTTKRLLSSGINMVSDEPVTFAAREAARREHNHVRYMARRYADSVGIEAKRRAPSEIATTANTPTNRAIKDALLLGDGETARALAAEYVASFDNAYDAANALASIRNSIRLGQPALVQLAPSETERRRFMRWAFSNLTPEGYARIKDTDEKYRKAAASSGLWKPETDAAAAKRDRKSDESKAEWTDSQRNSFLRSKGLKR